MKKNSLIIILLIIIFGLLIYIVINKNNKDINEEIGILESFDLDYVSIYLYTNGDAYLKVINKEEIEKLYGGVKLRERLITLYDNANYYDIYVNDDYKLKGYKIELDSKIKHIRKIDIDDNIYIVFVKDNNTIALFSYSDYYDLMHTYAIDNYNNYQNILDIDNNQIIYLDGSKEDILIK